MELRPGANEHGIALAGCRIERPPGFGGALEIVTASAALRAFPKRLSETLGICLKSGAAHRVWSDGRTLVYPADSVCIRHPGCVWSSEPAAVEFISLDIEPSFLPAGLEASPMRFLPADALPALGNVLKHLDTASEPMAQHEALAGLVTELSERSALRSEDLCATGERARIVQRARDFLAGSLERKPSLDEVARAASANKFVLVRYFKQQTGTTPHAYLVRLRIERARKLLSRGMAAGDVAAALAFADQGHFSRHFKQIVGVGPAAYARSTRPLRAIP